MHKRLEGSLTSLLIRQFFEFWPYYIAAFFSLWATHEIQSFLPFKAKELADMVELGSESIEIKIFFLLALGIIIFRTGSRLLFFYPARVLQKHLRLELLTRLEDTTPTRYPSYSSGQLFQILFNDVDQLRALVGFALLQVGNIIIALFVLIPKIVDFNSQLIYALIPMFTSFLLFTLFVSSNRHLYKLNQDMQGEVQNFIMESYAGKKTIKNYHAEDSFIKLFEMNSFKELMYFYRAGKTVSVSMPLVPLGVGLSFIWGAWIINDQALGASSLVLFSGFVFLFLEPLMFLSWIGVVFARSYASWVRMKKLVSNLNSPSTEEIFLQGHLPQNGIDREQLILQFWGEKLTFDYSKGDWNVLVGKTGHGKTYLMQQIAEALKARGTELSYVAQDPYLYNDTIKANIFLGHEPTVEEEKKAYEFCVLFGLDYLATSQSELFHMEVGEHGKRLSGGQAKRLCLVRSLMSGANILIWDDPFSSIDVILEKVIVGKLKNSELLLGKTVLLTTHRLTTMKLCDRVFFVDKEAGLVEQGSVQEILNKKGWVYDHFEGQLV